VQNIDNIIAKLSREHKLISDYVVKFAKGKLSMDEGFFSGLDAFLDFLKKDLLNHFELEEMVFFPAAAIGAASYDTTLMVLSFQKDHGILEKELENILARKEKAGKGKTDPELIEILSGFFSALKVHAKREFVELYPLIDSDPRCKTLVKQYLQDLRTEHSTGLTAPPK